MLTSKRPQTSKLVAKQPKPNNNQALEDENTILKEKVHKLSTIVKALNKGLIPKTTQKEEYKDKLIEQLKKRLVDSETQLQHINAGEPDDIKDSSELLTQIREKDLHLQTLQARFDSIEGTFREKEHIFSRTKAMLEESLNELQMKKTEIVNMQAQLSSAVYAAEQSKDIIKDYNQFKAQKEELEKRLFELTETSFMNKPSNVDSLNRLKQYEIELTQCKLKIEALKDDVIRKEIEKGKTEDKVKQAEKDTSTAREELIRIKAKYENDGMSMADIQKILKENDPSKFRETMEKLKVTGLPQWAELDFIDKRNKTLDSTNPSELLNEIERLKLEKAQFASELEKAQMQLKMKIEEDNEKEKLYEDKVKQMQEKINEQLKNTKNFMIAKSPNRFDNESIDNESNFTDIKSESFIEKSQTKIDILVTKAMFNQEIIKQMQLLSQGQMLCTYAVIDLFNHPSHRSDAFEGFSPSYLFQLQYKMSLNDDFIESLKKEALHIDIYIISANKEPTKFASTKLSLSQLINAEPCTTLKDKKVLYSNKSEIGTIEVKYRMRHPIPIGYLKPVTLSKVEQLSPIQAPQEKVKIIIKIISLEINVSDNRDKDKLCPFVGYKFFDSEFHHTTESIGSNPKFDDACIFEKVMDESFIDYIKKESMEFIVLDNVAPIDEAATMNQTSLARNDDNVLLGNASMELALIGKASAYELDIPIILGNKESGKLKVEMVVDKDIIRE